MVIRVCIHCLPEAFPLRNGVFWVCMFTGEPIEAYITLSHEVAQLGILERENAAILNAALRPLAAQIVPAFQEAMQDAGFSRRLYLTSNDGTLISAETAMRVIQLLCTLE